MEKSYYVYVDKKPCGEVFYVGKGNARRIKQEKRNRHHSFILKKYPEWSREIVFSGSEEDCLKKEKELISFYGRKNIKQGTLVNLCDGGLGAANYVMPQKEKERLSKNWRGEKNPLFNKKKYEWLNLDNGNKDEKTIYDMAKTYGGSRPHWTSVVNGDRKSHMGWALTTTKINIRSSKGKIFKFINIDGNVFFGTQSDLVKLTGISCASASRIVKCGKKTGGWYVEK
jgi:hypothetical protein